MNSQTLLSHSAENKTFYFQRSICSTIEATTVHNYNSELTPVNSKSTQGSYSFVYWETDTDNFVKLVMHQLP